MKRVDDLKLYRYAGCMWCGMVERALAGLELELDLCDIHQDSEHLQALLNATGRQTVPCLRITEGGEDRWMHESSAIIEYLQERFAGSA